MKGLDNETYVLMLIISNLVAIGQLVAAIKWQRIARLSFFLLFAWACYTNWKGSHQAPQDYLEYASLTWSGWYRDFINGWFAGHIELAVRSIAICQGLIGISLLLKGWVLRAGLIGAIIFLLAILPFGVGSGFPCTAIMAAALFIILNKNNTRFIWEK